jgi:hypothetical protein
MIVAVSSLEETTTSRIQAIVICYRPTGAAGIAHSRVKTGRAFLARLYR